MQKLFRNGVNIIGKKAMRFIATIAFIISVILNTANAKAEAVPINELLKKASKSDGGSVWVARITNIQIISLYVAARDAMEWCGSFAGKPESTANDAACELFTVLFNKAEIQRYDSSKLNNMIINVLKSQPQTQETSDHLNIIESQQKTLESNSAFFRDFMIKASDKKPKP